MNKHQLAILAKKIIYPFGEPYAFAGKKLRFVAGARPIKRKYINSDNDIARNDVLQINYFEENFKSHDILWDIGSHHGHYSVFAGSRVAGPNQVFSFEPDAASRKMQERNIELNGLKDKITLIGKAVSNRDGHVQFADMSGAANSHIIHNSETGGVKIESTTLNTLLKSLPKPTFVKVDTEGAEIHTLQEAGALLEDKRIRFVCELHPFAWNDFGVQFNQLLDILQKHGRKISLLDSQRKKRTYPITGLCCFSKCINFCKEIFSSASLA